MNARNRHPMPMTEHTSVKPKRAHDQFLQTEVPALLTILVVVLLVSLCKIDDYDVWFHTKSGEYYWNTRSLPQTDPFLFGMDEGVRDVSEWLSQLLMFFVWSAGGGIALQLANSLVLIATFLLLYRLIRIRTCEQWLALAMILIAIFVARRRWMPRPFQLVNLGIVLLFWVVERWKREGRDLPRAWIFALWFMLWTNLHPGAYSGVALLVLFWINSRFSPKRMPLSIPLAAGIGSLLNADLPGQLHKVLTCMTGGEAIQNVLEHMPADMDWIIGWFGVFALIVLATLPRMIGKKRWLDALLVAGTLFYSFRSRRYIDLLVIIASPPVAQCFSEDMKLIRWNAPMRLRRTAIGLLLVAIFAGGIFSMGMDRSYRAGFGVYWDQLPVQAVAKAQQFGIFGNVFCTYPWGGFLSFYNYPEWKVYIDGRCLMYGSERLNEYFDILRAENWQRTFDQHEVRCAVIDSVESGAGEGDAQLPNIADALFESPDWALVYWDDLSRLFVRRGCGYDPIIEHNEFHFVNPNQPMKSLKNADERTILNVQSELLRLLASDPTNVTALNLLGSIYIQRRDGVQAEKCFRRAVSVGNVTAGVYANLGISLLLQHRIEESVSFLERAVKSGLDDPTLYQQIAEMHQHLGNDRKAAQWQRRAARMYRRN